MLARPTSPTPAPATTPAGSNDSARLAGGWSPTGSVAFKLFGPADSNCAGTPLFSQRVDLAGAAAATSGGPVASAARTYHWTASYDRDDGNNAVASGCSDQAGSRVQAPPSLPAAANGLPLRHA